MDGIIINNGNSRKTYFDVHRIKDVHTYATGKNIKVGIIDRSFDKEQYGYLYKECIDIANNTKKDEPRGHGLMMALVLKEIAPDCSIYAINGVDFKEDISYEDQDDYRFELFSKAINWAIANKLDILTYSYPKFPDMYDEQMNNLIKKANKSNIVTTFIHNDSTNNIWPYGCFKFSNDQKFKREPDVNIYHFDYNYLNVQQAETFLDNLKKGIRVESGNDIPNFSFSSMSPVLAGFVAILKEISPNITLSECKKILIDTSHACTEKGQHWYDINPCEHIVDISKAVDRLRSSISPFPKVH